MSGLDTHTHTHTQDDYSNPRCACAPRVNKVRQGFSEEGAYRDGVKIEETSQGWDWKHTS